MESASCLLKTKVENLETCRKPSADWKLINVEIPDRNVYGQLHNEKHERISEGIEKCSIANAEEPIPVWQQVTATDASHEDVTLERKMIGSENLSQESSGDLDKDESEINIICWQSKFKDVLQELKLKPENREIMQNKELYENNLKKATDDTENKMSSLEISKEQSVITDKNLEIIKIKTDSDWTKTDENFSDICIIKSDIDTYSHNILTPNEKAEVDFDNEQFSCEMEAPLASQEISKSCTNLLQISQSDTELKKLVIPQVFETDIHLQNEHLLTKAKMDETHPKTLAVGDGNEIRFTALHKIVENSRNRQSTGESDLHFAHNVHVSKTNGNLPHNWSYSQINRHSSRKHEKDRNSPRKLSSCEYVVDSQSRLFACETDLYFPNISSPKSNKQKQLFYQKTSSDNVYETEENPLRHLLSSENMTDSSLTNLSTSSKSEISENMSIGETDMNSVQETHSKESNKYDNDIFICKTDIEKLAFHEIDIDSVLELPYYKNDQNLPHIMSSAPCETNENETAEKCVKNISSEEIIENSLSNSLPRDLDGDYGLSSDTYGNHIKLFFSEIDENPSFKVSSNEILQNPQTNLVRSETYEKLPSDTYGNNIKLFFSEIDENPSFKVSSNEILQNPQTNLVRSETYEKLPVNVSCSKIDGNSPLDVSLSETDENAQPQISSDESEFCSCETAGNTRLRKSFNRTNENPSIQESSCEKDGNNQLEISFIESDENSSTNVSSNESKENLPNNISCGETHANFTLNVPSSWTDGNTQLKMFSADTDAYYSIKLLCSETNGNPPFKMSSSETDGSNSVKLSTCETARNTQYKTSFSESDETPPMKVSSCETDGNIQPKMSFSKSDENQIRVSSCETDGNTQFKMSFSESHESPQVKASLCEISGNTKLKMSTSEADENRPNRIFSFGTDENTELIEPSSEKYGNIPDKMVLCETDEHTQTKMSLSEADKVLPFKMSFNETGQITMSSSETDGNPLIKHESSHETDKNFQTKMTISEILVNQSVSISSNETNKNPLLKVFSSKTSKHIVNKISTSKTDGTFSTMLSLNETAGNTQINLSSITTDGLLSLSLTFSDTQETSANKMSSIEANENVVTSIISRQSEGNSPIRISSSRSEGNIHISMSFNDTNRHHLTKAFFTESYEMPTNNVSSSLITEDPQTIMPSIEAESTPLNRMFSLETDNIILNNMPISEMDEHLSVTLPTSVGKEECSSSTVTSLVTDNISVNKMSSSERDGHLLAMMPTCGAEEYPSNVMTSFATGEISVNKIFSSALDGQRENIFSIETGYPSNIMAKTNGYSVKKMSCGEENEYISNTKCHFDVDGHYSRHMFISETEECSPSMLSSETDISVNTLFSDESDGHPSNMFSCVTEEYLTNKKSDSDNDEKDIREIHEYFVNRKSSMEIEEVSLNELYASETDRIPQNSWTLSEVEGYHVNKMSNEIDANSIKMLSSHEINESILSSISSYDTDVQSENMSDIEADASPSNKMYSIAMDENSTVIMPSSEAIECAQNTRSFNELDGKHQRNISSGRKREYSPNKLSIIEADGISVNKAPFNETNGQHSDNTSSIAYEDYPPSRTSSSETYESCISKIASVDTDGHSVYSMSFTDTEHLSLEMLTNEMDKNCIRKLSPINRDGHSLGNLSLMEIEHFPIKMLSTEDEDNSVHVLYSSETDLYSNNMPFSQTDPYPPRNVPPNESDDISQNIVSSSETTECSTNFMSSTETSRDFPTNIPSDVTDEYPPRKTSLTESDDVSENTISSIEAIEYSPNNKSSRHSLVNMPSDVKDEYTPRKTSLIESEVSDTSSDTVETFPINTSVSDLEDYMPIKMTGAGDTFVCTRATNVTNGDIVNNEPIIETNEDTVNKVYFSETNEDRVIKVSFNERNKVTVNKVSSSETIEDTLNKVSFSETNKDTVNNVSFSETNGDPVNNVSFSETNEDIVNKVSFSETNKDTVHKVSSSETNGDHVNNVSFSETNEDTVNKVSSSEINEDTVNKVSSSAINEDSVNKMSSSETNEDTVNKMSSSETNEVTVNKVSSNERNEGSVNMMVSSETNDDSVNRVSHSETNEDPVNKESSSETNEGFINKMSSSETNEDTVNKVLSIGIKEDTLNKLPSSETNESSGNMMVSSETNEDPASKVLPSKTNEFPVSKVSPDETNEFPVNKASYSETIDFLVNEVTPTKKVEHLPSNRLSKISSRETDENCEGIKSYQEAGVSDVNKMSFIERGKRLSDKASSIERDEISQDMRSITDTEGNLQNRMDTFEANEALVKMFPQTTVEYFPCQSNGIDESSLYTVSSSEAEVNKSSSFSEYSLKTISFTESDENHLVTVTSAEINENPMNTKSLSEYDVKPLNQITFTEKASNFIHKMILSEFDGNCVNMQAPVEKDDNAPKQITSYETDNNFVNIQVSDEIEENPQIRMTSKETDDNFVNILVSDEIEENPQIRMTSKETDDNFVNIQVSDEIEENLQIRMTSKETDDNFVNIQISNEKEDKHSNRISLSETNENPSNKMVSSESHDQVNLMACSETDENSVNMISSRTLSENALKLMTSIEIVEYYVHQLISSCPNDPENMMTINEFNENPIKLLPSSKSNERFVGQKASIEVDENLPDMMADYNKINKVASSEIDEICVKVMDSFESIEHSVSMITPSKSDINSASKIDSNASDRKSVKLEPFNETGHIHQMTASESDKNPENIMNFHETDKFLPDMITSILSDEKLNKCAFLDTGGTFVSMVNSIGRFEEKMNSSRSDGNTMDSNESDRKSVHRISSSENGNFTHQVPSIGSDTSPENMMTSSETDEIPSSKIIPIVTDEEVNNLALIETNGTYVNMVGSTESFGSSVQMSNTSESERNSIKSVPSFKIEDNFKHQMASNESVENLDLMMDFSETNKQFLNVMNCIDRYYLNNKISNRTNENPPNNIASIAPNDQVNMTASSETEGTFINVMDASKSTKTYVSKMKSHKSDENSATMIDFSESDINSVNMMDSNESDRNFVNFMDFDETVRISVKSVSSSEADRYHPNKKISIQTDESPLNSLAFRELDDQVNMQTYKTDRTFVNREITSKLDEDENSLNKIAPSVTEESPNKMVFSEIDKNPLYKMTSNMIDKSHVDINVSIDTIRNPLNEITLSQRDENPPKRAVSTKADDNSIDVLLYSKPDENSLNSLTLNESNENPPKRTVSTKADDNPVDMLVYSKPDENSLISLTLNESNENPPKRTVSTKADDNPVDVLVYSKPDENSLNSLTLNESNENPPKRTVSTKADDNPVDVLVYSKPDENSLSSVILNESNENPPKRTVSTKADDNPVDMMVYSKPDENSLNSLTLNESNENPPKRTVSTKADDNPVDVLVYSKPDENSLSSVILNESNENPPKRTVSTKADDNPVDMLVYSKPDENSLNSLTLNESNENPPKRTVSTKADDNPVDVLVYSKPDENSLSSVILNESNENPPKRTVSTKADDNPVDMLVYSKPDENSLNSLTLNESNENPPKRTVSTKADDNPVDVLVYSKPDENSLSSVILNESNENPPKRTVSTKADDNPVDMLVYSKPDENSLNSLTLNESNENPPKRTVSTKADDNPVDVLVYSKPDENSLSSVILNESNENPPKRTVSTKADDNPVDMLVYSKPDENSLNSLTLNESNENPPKRTVSTKADDNPVDVLVYSKSDENSLSSVILNESNENPPKRTVSTKADDNPINVLVYSKPVGNSLSSVTLNESYETPPNKTALSEVEENHVSVNMMTPSETGETPPNKTALSEVEENHVSVNMMTPSETGETPPNKTALSEVEENHVSVNMMTPSETGETPPKKMHPLMTKLAIHSLKNTSVKNELNSPRNYIVSPYTPLPYKSEKPVSLKLRSVLTDKSTPHGWLVGQRDTVTSSLKKMPLGEANEKEKGTTQLENVVHKEPVKPVKLRKSIFEKPSSTLGSESNHLNHVPVLKKVPYESNSPKQLRKCNDNKSTDHLSHTEQMVAFFSNMQPKSAATPSRKSHDSSQQSHLYKSKRCTVDQISANKLKSHNKEVNLGNEIVKFPNKTCEYRSVSNAVLDENAKHDLNQGEPQNTCFDCKNAINTSKISGNLGHYHEKCLESHNNEISQFIHRDSLNPRSMVLEQKTNSHTSEHKHEDKKESNYIVNETTKDDVQNLNYAKENPHHPNKMEDQSIHEQIFLNKSCKTIGTQNSEKSEKPDFHTNVGKEIEQNVPNQRNTETSSDISDLSLKSTYPIFQGLTPLVAQKTHNPTNELELIQEMPPDKRVSNKKDTPSLKCTNQYHFKPKPFNLICSLESLEVHGRRIPSETQTESENLNKTLTGNQHCNDISNDLNNTLVDLANVINSSLRRIHNPQSPVEPSQKSYFVRDYFDSKVNQQHEEKQISGHISGKDQISLNSPKSKSEVQSPESFLLNKSQEKSIENSENRSSLQPKPKSAEGISSAGQQPSSAGLRNENMNPEITSGRNSQCVEAVLLLMQSMQNVLLYMSKMAACIPALPGEEIETQQGDSRKQLFSPLIVNAATRKPCFKQTGKLKVTAPGYLHAYNIANYVVSQARKKISELFPECAERVDSGNVKDYWSTALVLTGLRETLNELEDTYRLKSHISVGTSHTFPDDSNSITSLDAINSISSSENKALNDHAVINQKPKFNENQCLSSPTVDIDHYAGMDSDDRLELDIALCSLHDALAVLSKIQTSSLKKAYPILNVSSQAPVSGKNAMAKDSLVSGHQNERLSDNFTDSDFKPMKSLILKLVQTVCEEVLNMFTEIFDRLETNDFRENCNASRDILLHCISSPVNATAEMKATDKICSKIAEMSTTDKIYGNIAKMNAADKTCGDIAEMSVTVKTSNISEMRYTDNTCGNISEVGATNKACIIKGTSEISHTNSINTDSEAPRTEKTLKCLLGKHLSNSFSDESTTSPSEFLQKKLRENLTTKLLSMNSVKSPECVKLNVNNSVHTGSKIELNADQKNLTVQNSDTRQNNTDKNEPDQQSTSTGTLQSDSKQNSIFTTTSSQCSQTETNSSIECYFNSALSQSVSDRFSAQRPSCGLTSDYSFANTSRSSSLEMLEQMNSESRWCTGHDGRLHFYTSSNVVLVAGRGIVMHIGNNAEHVPLLSICHPTHGGQPCICDNVESPNKRFVTSRSLTTNHTPPMHRRCHCTGLNTPNQVRNKAKPHCQVLKTPKCASEPNLEIYSMVDTPKCCHSQRFSPDPHNFVESEWSLIRFMPQDSQVSVHSNVYTPRNELNDNLGNTSSHDHGHVNESNAMVNLSANSKVDSSNEVSHNVSSGNGIGTRLANNLQHYKATNSPSQRCKVFSYNFTDMIPEDGLLELRHRGSKITIKPLQRQTAEKCCSIEETVELSCERCLPCLCPNNTENCLDKAIDNKPPLSTLQNEAMYNNNISKYEVSTQTQLQSEIKSKDAQPKGQMSGNRGHGSSKDWHVSPTQINKGALENECHGFIPRTIVSSSGYSLSSRSDNLPLGSEHGCCTEGNKGQEEKESCLSMAASKGYLCRSCGNNARENAMGHLDAQACYKLYDVCSLCSDCKLSFQEVAQKAFHVRKSREKEDIRKQGDFKHVASVHHKYKTLASDNGDINCCTLNTDCKCNIKQVTSKPLSKCIPVQLDPCVAQNSGNVPRVYNCIHSKVGIPPAPVKRNNTADVTGTEWEHSFAQKDGHHGACNCVHSEKGTALNIVKSNSPAVVPAHWECKAVQNNENRPRLCARSSGQYQDHTSRREVRNTNCTSSTRVKTKAQSVPLISRVRRYADTSEETEPLTDGLSPSHNLLNMKTEVDQNMEKIWSTMLSLSSMFNSVQRENTQTRHLIQDMYRYFKPSSKAPLPVGSCQTTSESGIQPTGDSETGMHLAHNIETGTVKGKDWQQSCPQMPDCKCHTISNPCFICDREDFCKEDYTDDRSLCTSMDSKSFDAGHRCIHYETDKKIMTHKCKSAPTNVNASAKCFDNSGENNNSTKTNIEFVDAKSYFNSFKIQYGAVCELDVNSVTRDKVSANARLADANVSAHDSSLDILHSFGECNSIFNDFQSTSSTAIDELCTMNELQPNSNTVSLIMALDYSNSGLESEYDSSNDDSFQELDIFKDSSYGISSLDTSNTRISSQSVQDLFDSPVAHNTEKCFACQQKNDCKVKQTDLNNRNKCACHICQLSKTKGCQTDSSSDESDSLTGPFSHTSAFDIISSSDASLNFVTNARNDSSHFFSGKTLQSFHLPVDKPLGSGAISQGTVGESTVPADLVLCTNVADCTNSQCFYIDNAGSDCHKKLHVDVNVGTDYDQCRTVRGCDSETSHQLLLGKLVQLSLEKRLDTVEEILEKMERYLSNMSKSSKSERSNARVSSRHAEAEPISKGNNYAVHNVCSTEELLQLVQNQLSSVQSIKDVQKEMATGLLGYRNKNMNYGHDSDNVNAAGKYIIDSTLAASNSVTALNSRKKYVTTKDSPATLNQTSNASCMAEGKYTTTPEFADTRKDFETRHKNASHHAPIICDNFMESAHVTDMQAIQRSGVSTVTYCQITDGSKREQSIAPAHGRSYCSLNTSNINSSSQTLKSQNQKENILTLTSQRKEKELNDQKAVMQLTTNKGKNTEDIDNPCTSEDTYSSDLSKIFSDLPEKLSSGQNLIQVLKHYKQCIQSLKSELKSEQKLHHITRAALHALEHDHSDLRMQISHLRHRHGKSDKNSRLQEIMARTQCIPDFPDLMSNT